MKKYILLPFFLLMIFNLQAQEKGKKAIPENYFIYSIYYGGGSFYIGEKQEQGLYDFLKSIPNIENYAISVHSYTDDIGGVDYNQWLSQNRSETVIQLLEGQSISRDLISIEDFGELNPVYDNSTWEGKLKNRRTDVILIPLEI
jgi:outer membrane protein OmpA-like peptidoglycan-associated protein